MPDASQFPAVPGVEIRQVIGRGGFATVYSGFQAAFNRLVAVKVLQRFELDDDARQRFDRECQVMGTLSNHPYIMTLYVAGYTDDGRPYMVMPYVSDGTLDDRIRRRGAMPWKEVVTTGIRLSGALQTAHSSDVLHRDIKPANVLRAEYGDLLGDFGIARIGGGHETKSGVITASIAHAPPEVLEGDPPDERADVYSLGSTLFEALSGKAAFTKSADSIGFGPMIRRILMDAPPTLAPDVAPAAVSQVIERALAKDKADRHASAEEFGKELQAAQRSLSVDQTDMLILGSAAFEAISAPPEPPKNATIVFDRSDLDEPDGATAHVERAAGVEAEFAADIEAPPPAAPVDEPVVGTTLAPTPRTPETPSPTPYQANPEPPRDATQAPPPPVTPEPPHEATQASPPQPTPDPRQYATAAPPQTPPEPSRSRNGLLMAAVAGSVAVLLVGGGLFLANQNESDPPTSTAPTSEAPPVSNDVGAPISASVESTTTMTPEPPRAPLVLPPGDPVQIQLLNPRIQSEVLAELVRGFESENPGISVEIVEEGFYRTSLDMVLNGEVQPDVALLADRAVQAVLDQVDYIPVQDFIDRDDFDASVLFANAADMYSTPDGLAAMPWNIAIPMFYANGDVLERAGIDLAPDASFSTTGLLDRCNVLADIVERCMEFGLDWFMFTQMITNSGGRLLDTDGFEGSANAAAFDDEIGQQTFSFLVDSVQDGDAIPEGDERLFDSGEVAFYLDTSSGLGSLDQANSATAEPVELIAFGVPHLDGVEPTGVVPGGAALWIFDNDDDRRSIASWLLVDYLSELPQLLTLHVASGYVPARSDAAVDEGFLEFWLRKPVYRGAYDELAAAASDELPNDRDGRAGALHSIDRTIAARIEQAQLGELETDEAFDALVTDVNTLLTEYDQANE